MKNNKIKYYFFYTFLIIFSSVCCKQNIPNISKTDTRTKGVFLGDSMLAKNNYFKTIASEKGFSILEKQNEIYLKEFSDFNKSGLKSKNLNNILLKLIKENSSEIKVNFYTYENGKKIDSLDFYRNISGDNFDKYICLSYFNEKNDKIWQIKYFSTKSDKSSSIISYSESSIASNGKIKLDSLHYLDESLDVEMDKYNLYY